MVSKALAATLMVVMLSGCAAFGNLQYRLELGSAIDRCIEAVDGIDSDQEAIDCMRKALKEARDSRPE